MSPVEHLEATVKILEHTLNHAIANHSADPKETLHCPASHEVTHSWFERHFPKEHLESIESKWHLGIYVIDRKTGEKHFEDMSMYVRIGMHLLYYGSEQEKALHWKRTLQLLEEQSVKMGREYDDPKSKAHIRPFISSFRLEDSLVELKKPNPDDYDCFNDFFARELKEGARPPGDPENPKAVSSPADCRLTAFPTVDLATKYWIKGFGFTLSKLLGNDDELADKFDGGSIVIARLAPQDYHRWHSPIDGTVESVKLVPGAYYTVNPQAINEPGTMDVFCENKRSVMVCKRRQTGSPVAIVAVGAMLVGTIVYEEGVDKPGAEIRRAQCLGAFKYGGSTVVVLYPKGEVVLDDDLVNNSVDESCETIVRAGERVGAGPA
ncbi:phosphatidylserine decarboxylase proenzyme 2 precursor [Diplogelasinospora grovesii]|uniref:Phosphatidylserine decarboxylase proenzyme 2 n=1 Tax=Diplogelasinospora grovesii TaxID=303347 RepID=A0AAN6N0N5_9PEZI|nr:phosphatidylserine decarboxylase proenzyme 2 precursor [Diplogelasinospora grovesii]